MRTESFDDFDAFAGSIHGIESKMLLRNPKRQTWSISSVDLSGLKLQLGRLGSGNIAQGALCRDAYMLYMPLSDGVEYSANGTVLDRESFAILEPGCEFCVSTKVEHDWCALSVPTHLVDEMFETPSVNGTASVRVTRPNRVVATRFRYAVEQVMAAASDCPQFEEAPGSAAAAACLFTLGAQVIGRPEAPGSMQKGRPTVPRQEIIRRSSRLLEQSAGRHLLVGELACAAGVSERTLRSAFNEYFGIGPVRYLQLRQLHQVRTDLKAVEPEAASVSDVLVAHGAWEFSRFASRYRKLFGELPSETLRAKPR